MKQDDTSLAAPVLRRSLPQGILVHSADLSRSLRAAIEDYMAVPLKPDEGSEVILSTETLSYGVNLAIDDVALLSLEFPASERHQEDGAPLKRLSHCAFSNMCGRAGRLNHLGVEPTVYVWPLTQFNYGSLELVRHFYCEPDNSETSKIVHADDIEALERIREDASDRARAPILFSYPLARTVLDGLRYIGGAPGMSGAITVPATLREISRNFTRHLLHCREPMAERKKEQLGSCVKLIIEESMGAEFGLVRLNGPAYKITELGSSIIDTGTEISTLAPLKGALDGLMDELRGVAMHDVPVEVLLLPILVQNEAHRQFFLRMPEIKCETAEGENRKELLRWIRGKFEHLGFTDPVVEALERFLARCDASPKHSPCDTRASPFVHDACLRLFCGLMLWVSGHSIENIHDQLRPIGKINSRAVDLNTNFSIFAERISWKLVFLGDLMRFSENQSEWRILQTKARRLILRLRLGCAEEALPFLSASKPGQQPVERNLAHTLLKAGATAKTVCSGEFDVDSVAPGQARRVRTQVQNFIGASFENLKDEFVFKAVSDEGEDVSEGYWNFAEASITNAIQSGKSPEGWPQEGREFTFSSSTDTGSEATTNVPSIQIFEQADAMQVNGFSVQWEGDTPKLIPSLKWHVQAGFGSEELRPAPPAYASVIIDFPWLLNAAPIASGTIRMSPAAFGILLTLISRSFLIEPVAALEAIAGGAAALSTETLLDELYPHLLLAQIPEPLFAAWTGYWDAS